MNFAKNRLLWADSSLLLVAAIWGGTFVMVKDALSEAGPFTFLALRFALAALVVTPTLAKRGGALSFALLLSGSAIGMFLFVGYGFQTVGLQFTSASKAGFITGLAVVIVPLISALALRRPLARQTGAGVVLASMGLALLSFGDDLSVQLGDLLIFGCAISFALHILAVGLFAPRYDVLALTSIQILAAAILNSAGACSLKARA